MRVLALTKYGREGASSRIRLIQFLPALEDAGFSVTVSSLFPEGYLRRRYAEGNSILADGVMAIARRLTTLLRCRSYDLLWIEGEIVPWLPPVVESTLLEWGPRTILDYDDAIFHRYDRNPRRWVRHLMGDKIDRLMREARLITAGSPYLVDRARRAGARRVEQIPSVVDAQRYEPRRQDEGGGCGLVVGWIGTPMTRRYVDAVEPILMEILEREEGVLRLVGASTQPQTRGSVQEVQWSEDTEVEQIRGFDVGIMPLMDTPWERGK